MGQEGGCAADSAPATTYDVAGNTATKTAVDPDHDGNTADNQVTVYAYADTGSPSPVTKIKYPDSVKAEWDAVTLTYHLDGRAAARTSQKAQTGETGQA